MIENHMFAADFENAVTLHFHTRPEFVGALMEGIALFTPGGRFMAANRNGLFQLDLSSSVLQAHTLSSLFGLPCRPCTITIARRRPACSISACTTAYACAGARNCA